MSSYQIMENNDGEEVILTPDGRAVDLELIEMILELHRQNPQFAELWIDLGRSYLFTGPSVGEA